MFICKHLVAEGRKYRQENQKFGLRVCRLWQYLHIYKNIRKFIKEISVKCFNHDTDSHSLFTLMSESVAVLLIQHKLYTF